MKKYDVLLFFIPMLISCAANNSRLTPITEPVRHHKVVGDIRSFDRLPGIAYIAVVVTEDTCRRTTIYVDSVKLGTVQEKSITYFPVPLGGHYIIARVGRYYFIDSLFFNDNDTIFFKVNFAANSVVEYRFTRIDSSHIPEGMRTHQDFIRNDSIIDKSPLNDKRYKRLLCHYQSGNTAVPAVGPPYAIGFRLGVEYMDVFDEEEGGMDRHIALYCAFLRQLRLGVQFDHHQIHYQEPIVGHYTTYHMRVNVNGYEIYPFLRASLPVSKGAFFVEPGFGYYRKSVTKPSSEKSGFGYYRTSEKDPFSKNAALFSIIGGIQLSIFDIHGGYKKAFGVYSYYNVGINCGYEFRIPVQPCDQYDQ